MLMPLIWKLLQPKSYARVPKSDTRQSNLPEGCIELILLQAGERVSVRSWDEYGGTLVRTLDLDSVVFWGKTRRQQHPTWLVSGTDVDTGEGCILCVKDMEPA